MAATARADNDQVLSLDHVGIAVHDAKDMEKKQCLGAEDESFDYYQRAQWLRAAVLGATDGLVSIASLMMGVGAVKKEFRAMLLAGFAGLVAGACSMAIGEFVSVSTQYDIEMAQLKREKKRRKTGDVEVQDIKEDMDKEKLPNPVQAAFASALSFSVGGLVPLLAAVVVKDHKVRLELVVGVASLTLIVFGVIGAKFGRTAVGRSCARLLVGGWMAMAITFGMTKFIGSGGLEL
ncbi:vacuolar iron transporter homolog 4-like [Juglans microcarpa x Juglans regia]|uniref:vacuolar iron transporter homolog 4-like n=1 Tax=Juglans microcarpa x Juglans regia TaxID=2249226 RepID=UPI001B7E19E7|nr:vacuolar iron transporter homolog 4-like [Juglans microcarpa x Juglans regia]